MATVIPSAHSDAEDFIRLVGFDTAALHKGEYGAGRKGALAFEETADSDSLFQDSGASSRDNGKSRKLGVFLSPDGTSVIIGTAYINPRVRRISTAAGAVKFDALLARGYTLLASVKTTEPTKGYARTYSLAQWKRIAEALRAMAGAARGMATAMETKLRENAPAKRRELSLSECDAEQMDALLGASKNAITQREIADAIAAHVTSELAARAFEAIRKQKHTNDETDRVERALASVAEANDETAATLRAMCLELKRHGLNFTQASDAITGRFQKAYSLARSSAEFAQALSRSSAPNDRCPDCQRTVAARNGRAGRTAERVGALLSRTVRAAQAVFTNLPEFSVRESAAI